MEGRLPEPMKFKGNLNENFKRFLQNFETYLIATEKDGKSDKIKIALLLNTIGSEGVETFNTFKFESPDDEKEYDKVVREFKKYCAPRKNRTYERFVFNNRVQAPDEPFDHFFGELRKLIQSCEYDTQEESILVDRIILGTNDPRIQEKLLNIQNLALDVAIDMCRNAEATKRHIENVRQKDETSINAIKKNEYTPERRTSSNREDKQGGRNNGKKFKCMKCNKTHEYGMCPAFGQKCHRCGKLNHFIVACRSDMRQVREVSQQETRPADEDDQLFVCSVVKVGEVKKDNSSVWMETVKLNGREINCKVDTGSEVNIIPRQVYNQLTMGKLTKSSIVLEAYGGAKLNPIGIVKLNCRIEDKSLELDFLVLDLNVKPIIGLPSCYDLGFIKKTSSIESIKNREQFIKENQDVFEGLGSFPEECNISLKKDSIPIARPCRRVPLVIKERLQAKLKSLEEQKIISKVNNATEHVRERAGFHKGDKVVFRNEAREWQPASIIASHEAPRSYLINTGTNVLRRNSFHLRKSLANRQIDHTPCDLENINAGHRNSSTHVEADTSLIDSSLENPISPMLTNNNQKPTSQGSARPSRTIRQPSRLNEYVLY
ncbi:hypothetical protein JTB14_003252 [Gonioctena quinquepunctata]|nr:hypothetical protein JTB14_003252 [Gonioctena quinquepunctata]